MKQNNKKVILITIIFCILLLTGCKNIRFSTTKGTENPKVLKTEDQNLDETNIDGEEIDTTQEEETENKTQEEVKKTELKEDPTPTVIQPVANTELMVYTVNSDAEKETVTAMIPKKDEITPQLIVDTVVDSMADNSLTINIESVTTEEASVIVSFYKDQSFLNVGGGYETAILDAIAQSLIDNLDDYNKVIFRMEGDAYVSGHIELGIDEVYLEK